MNQKRMMLKKAKRTMAAVLVAVLLFAQLPATVSAATVSSGTCGENLTWTLDDQGTLTISGTGPMSNWSNSSSVPWEPYCSEIKAVVIKNGVTSIGKYAFNRATSITSVSIPGSVTNIESYVFYSANFISITYCGTGKQWASVTRSEYWAIENANYYVKDVPIDYYHNCNSKGRCTICGSGAEGVCGTDLEWKLDPASGSLTISGTGDMNSFYSSAPWDNYASIIKNIIIEDGVTSITEHAFAWYTDLTSVIIGADVTSIGQSAFYCYITDVYIKDIASWCEIDFHDAYANPITFAKNVYLNNEILTELIIPEGVTTIQNNAFNYCTSITNVVIPGSVEDIGYQAFYGCDNLTKVVLEEGVKNIGTGSFRYCLKLKEINIPDGVVSIGDYAFRYDESITSISIPDSVQSIGMLAFERCRGLSTIAIPEGIKFISVGTFGDCIGLNSITIPNSVTTIYDDAFYDCSGLKDVYYGGSAAQWEQITIGDNNEYLFNATLHTVEPEVSFGEKVYHNLRLQDLTKIGYAFTITTNVDVDAYGVLIWTGNADDEITVDTEGVQNKTLIYDSGFYTAESDGVYAQRLDLPHYAKPYVKIGDQYFYGDVDGYSPLTYAQTILDGSNEKLKQLMVDMLNYGAYAQLYFAESNKEAAPEVLVNNLLTAEQKVMNWRDELKVATPTVTKDTVKTLETTWYGTNLNLLDAIQMNMAATGNIAGMYYWTEEDYNNADVLNAETASGEAVIRVDGIYTIGGLTDIVAQSVGEVFYICSYDESGRLGAIRADSVAAYATRLMESTASTEVTVDLAKALLVYGNSAEEYFEQNN